MKKKGLAALDAIVDTVLAYRRPRKAKPKKRRKIKKQAAHKKA